MNITLTSLVKQLPVCITVLALNILTAAAAQAQTLAIGFTAPASLFINNTNAAKLGLGGSCSTVGAQISIALGSYGNASAVCQADKTWSVTNINAVDWADGKVVLTAAYSASPSVFASREFTKDTKNPVVQIVAPRNGTVFTPKNLTGVGISGICNGGAVQVTFRDTAGHSVVVPLTCGANHLFSTTVDISTFKDGDLNLEVTDTSASGNVAVASSSYLKSTAAVTVTVASLYKFVNIENAAKHSFNGKCTASGGIIFLDIFTPSNPAVAAQSLSATCIDNKWSIENVSLASALFPDGNLTFKVGHINATTGESAEPASMVLVKNTTPVKVKIVSPANGYKMNTVTGTMLKVSGTCSINGKTVKVGYLTKSGGLKLLANANCAANGYSADVDFAANADGVITLFAQLTDATGNIGRQDLSFSKKMSLPQVTIVASAMNVNIGNVATMSLSGQCSEWADLGQQVTIETVPAMPSQPLYAICQPPAKGKGLGTWSLPNLSFTALPNGTFKVTAKHNDFAGNMAQASLDLIKDTLQPTLKITSPALGKNEHFVINAANASSTITVSGTCNKPGAAITASDVAPTVITACTSLKTWSVQLDFSKVADGKSLVENFKIADSVGNSATQSLGFDKKTTIPNITIAKPLANSYLNISNAHIMDVTGACSEFDNLGTPVYAQLGTIKQEAICVKGSYYLQMSANALDNGKLVLTVSQTDYVGNTGSVSINLIKDTFQPTLTITQPKLGKGEHFIINAANASKPVIVAGECNKPGAKIVASDVAPKVETLCGDDKKWTVSLNFASVKDGKSLVENFTIIDSADNRATQSIGFDKKTSYPTITIASPKEGDFLGIANVATLDVRGSCSEWGELGTNVDLSLGTIKATAVCNKGSYMVQMSGTALGEGAVILTASQTDYIGNTAKVSVNLVKRTKMPTLSLYSPGKSFVITDENASAVPFKGSCSEFGRDVVLSGAISGRALCGGNKYSPSWEISANVTDVADGVLEFTFKHSDAAGNEAVQTLSLVKRTCASLLPEWSQAPVPQAQSIQPASAEMGILPAITPHRVLGPMHGTWTAASNTTLANSTNGVYAALYKLPCDGSWSCQNGSELVQKWDGDEESLTLAQRLYAGQPFQLKTATPLSYGSYFLAIIPKGYEAPQKITGNNTKAFIAPLYDSVADMLDSVYIKVSVSGVEFKGSTFNVLVNTRNLWNGDTVVSNPSEICTRSAIRGTIDPLMIDFSGDNIELSSQKDGVDFDLTGDGLSERISWPLDRRNGFLVIDSNDDGQISGSELFGNYTVGPDGKLAPHGFAALAKYDLNKDGVIDSKDEVYSSLKFWYDANRDAKVRGRELQSLEEVGVVSIELQPQVVKEKDAYGNTTTLRAYVHLRNGGKRIIRDVWFKPLRRK